MSTTYFSERERGPRPRTAEAISQPVRRALLRQIQIGIGNGSYGWRFPEQCCDERGTCGTDERAFWDTAAAEVPDLLLPENASSEQAVQCADDVDTGVFLDLLEFCARAVARPVQRDYHSFFGHYHLGFDRDAGLTDFLSHVNQLFRRNLSHVNQLFRRNGVAFELSDEGDARRLGAPGLREELREAEFDTGDAETDRLLAAARQRILSPREEDRRDALEKLWDAFERVKTLETGASKRAQADRLLDRTAESPKLRELLGQEAIALTEIGNGLRIRHSETTQEPVQTLEQIDYLFHRMFSFLRLVLRATGRGS